MKTLLVKLIKSKWAYVILLAILGFIGGETYSEQIVALIRSLLGP